MEVLSATLCRSSGQCAATPDLRLFVQSNWIDCNRLIRLRCKGKFRENFEQHCRHTHLQRAVKLAQLANHPIMAKKYIAFYIAAMFLFLTLPPVSPAP